MAFRGYELNLMLRVQDRATTRLRRLSQDIGGINRAAQIQRDAARLSRNAISANARAEQAAAAARLRGLNQASVAASTLSQNLSRVVSQGQLTALEAQRVEQAFTRIARSERMLQRARLATHVGSVAAMGGGLGLAIAGGAAAQFAAFNREAVAAATQMRGVNESFTATVEISKVLQTGLIDLTRQFPATATEMADSIYDIASGMDVQIKKTSELTETQQRFNYSFKVLQAANKVAVAGNVDLATATDAVITTLNNFPAPVDKINQRLNELFAIVRFGKGTFAQFSPQFGRVASAANAAGQSLLEAGGALAFLSQRLPLPQATTALVRIFQIIGRKEFTTGFQQLFKVSPFKEGSRQLKNLSELMFIIEKQGPRIWKGFTKGGVDLMNVLQNITAAGQNAMKGTTDAVGLVSTEFARRAITNFIVFGKQYRSVLEDVSGTQGEFIRSYQAFREQPGVQWQIAINQLKAFAIVVGQDVIPVVLRFIDFITRLSHRYQDLSPHTRRLIAQFTTWGSIIALVGGALVTVVGAVGILVARLAGLLATLGLAGGGGVLGRMTRLGIALSRIAAIGAISIIIKTAWKGDASAKDYLLGALAGGIAGARFGPLGAAAGAITVPAIIGITSDKNFNDVVADQVLEKTSRSGAKAKAYGIYLARNIREGISSGMTRQEFDDFTNRFAASDAIERNRTNLHNFVLQNNRTTDSVLDKWRKLASDLTGIDLFGGITAQAAEAAATIQLNLARAQAGGNEAAIRRALNLQIAFDKREAARLEKLPKTAERVKNLIQLYNDQASAQGQLNALNEKANKTTEKENRAKQLAAEKARSRNEAQRAQTNKITEAADRLVTKYKELEEANKAAFQIFAGPISRGPIAQIYNNINQILTGFGRRPIPIPIKLQIQDITAQVANFERFVQDIAVLRRRGLPAELLTELQAKGPEEALPIVEGLRNAGGGAIRQYVKIWKQGQTLVKTTTNQQMNATLKQWQSYGKSIAWQIVQGLADDKTQATLKAGYRKYITDTFKSVLGKELSTAIGKKVGEYQSVQTAKDKKTPGKKAPGTKPEPTRTTQSHTTINYHGDEIKILASGATADAVYAAINRASFAKRHRL